MLCRSCAELTPSQRRADASTRHSAPGWSHLIPLFCSSCGAAISDAGIEELFIAKVRQLELFGFSAEPLPAGGGFARFNITRTES